MKVIMLGDVVGKPGREAIKQEVAGLLQAYSADLLIVNGENAASGNGITAEIVQEMLTAGVSVITMGNHVWDKREIETYITDEPRLVRPGNYPVGTPGKGYYIAKISSGHKVGVISLSGRVYMPELDCPFRKAEELTRLVKQETNIVLIDFHGEATSEKLAMGFFMDGKVSAVCGTHTHVLTADAQILPGGTGYITDLGMTGPRDSILGIKKEIIIKRFITGMPQRFEIADGAYQINGVCISIDESTGLANGIETIDTTTC